MKPSLYTLVIICLVFLFSCVKDKGVAPIIENTTPKNTQIPGDSIYYNDFPDVVIQSVFGHTQIFTCNAPVPSDTSVSSTILIGPNNMEEITFSCQTSYQQISASNPCSNYKYFIEMNFSNANNTFVAKASYGTVDSLSLNDTIGPGSIYRNGPGSIKVYVPGFAYSFNMLQDYFIGVKLEAVDGSHYGWIRVNLNSDNSITIKEYAINLTPGNDISAGQIQ